MDAWEKITRCFLYVLLLPLAMQLGRYINYLNCYIGILCGAIALVSIWAVCKFAIHKINVRAAERIRREKIILEWKKNR